LDYPIIDTDGHVLEVAPVFVAYLHDVAGAEVAQAYADSFAFKRYTAPWTAVPDDPRAAWTPIRNYWGWPTKNTLDRATATIPGLYANRMDDLGIDYSILYPSAGLGLILLDDPELREAVVRAFNQFVLELCAPYPQRMTAVASIPMGTPQEAIRHLEHCVRELGHKVVSLQGHVFRPIPDAARLAPDVAHLATRIDYFGLDSEHDYDPVWAKCVELGVTPTFHTGITGLRATRSVSNYTFNHIGTMAQAQEGLAKALFLGGVPHRFPELNFGFLECGAAWACSLLAELVGHFGKRSLDGMSYVDPQLLDVAEMMEHFSTYGDPFTKAHLREARSYYERPFLPLPEHDDFSQAGVSSAVEVGELFTERFYIGCEADDRSIGWAFDRRVNPLGLTVRATFGSDVGHWDVTDVGDVVVEAYELAEDGLISEADFRQFVFENPVRLHTRANPAFFDGTAVAPAVQRFLEPGHDG
jgi:predicted TIM-barrel fold metal-dependent hydrolase